MTRYLTVTPGLALTIASLEQQHRRDTVIDGTSLTPHLAVAWDATHDGRTVLRGSFNQYVDTDVGRLARHTLGDAVPQRVPLERGQPAATPTSAATRAAARRAPSACPAGPPASTPNGNPCRQKLQDPRGPGSTRWAPSAR